MKCDTSSTVFHLSWHQDILRGLFVVAKSMYHRGYKELYSLVNVSFLWGFNYHKISLTRLIRCLLYGFSSSFLKGDWLRTSTNFYFKTPSTLYTPFSNENDTVLFRIRLLSTLQRSENGSFRKRSPEWNDLKTVLFENAVFLVWTAKTILSENDDVTTTTPPGCRPLNREYTR